jgi:hypothetical protein
MSSAIEFIVKLVIVFLEYMVYAGVLYFLVPEVLPAAKLTFSQCWTWAIIIMFPHAYYSNNK